MLSTNSKQSAGRSQSVQRKGTPYFVATKSSRPRLDSLQELLFSNTSFPPADIREFRSLVWRFYKTNGRHELPWRKTTDAYKILVSEVMLQQTQVERVIPFYKNFLKKFPTVRALSKAPLGEVLIAWQGLGYNRRAKMFYLAAKEVVEKHKGKFPDSVEELESLPGIGPYTARAVAAFAYNQDVVFVETNLRTVITHHFFKDREQVSDKEILEVLTQVFPKPSKIKSKSSASRSDSCSRKWYAALMDYGSHLKRSGIRINAKSKTYTKQSKFIGSDREARGVILKELAKGSKTKTLLLALLGGNRVTQMEAQLQNLVSEGLIRKKGRLFSLPR